MASALQAQGTAPASAHHDDLRHARSDRGPDLRRPGRRHERGHRGAGRHSGRALRAAAPHLRRLLHRVAWHERVAGHVRERRPAPVRPRRGDGRAAEDDSPGHDARDRRAARVRAILRRRDPRAHREDQRHGAASHRRNAARERDHQAAGEGGRAASRRARLRVLRSGAHAAVRGRLDRRRHAAMKTPNQKAWWLVVPVVLLVAFNALIPLMTVINYSVQETFGENVFFFEGVKWFQAVLHSERFHNSLQRQLLFTGIILAIEVPLGVAIALAMPRRGPWVSVCLVLVAMPLLIPWNVVGAMWNLLALPDIGLLGRTLNAVGIDYNYTRQPFAAWATLIAMDVWHWTSLVVLLAYAGLSAIPDAYYQAAKIDGASSGAVFRYIQLPKMNRVLTIALLLRFMDSFMTYTEPIVLTAGGTGNATTLLSIDLVKVALGQFDLGPAAAMSLIYFLIVLLLSWIFYTVITKDEAE